MRTAIVTSMLAALVFACGGGEPAAQQATVQTETAAQEVQQQDAPPADSASASELGVAECDAHVEKFLACIDKVPAQAQAVVRQGFEQSRETWQQAAATPEGRASLAMACRQADEAARMAMQAYGCAW